MSFYEIYFKPTWTITDSFAVGGNLWYSPSWLNTGASGTCGSLFRHRISPKVWAWYVSGELGHYYCAGFALSSVTGVDAFPSYTAEPRQSARPYRKMFYFWSLRYYDTDLHWVEL